MKQTTNKNTVKQASLKGTNKKCVCPICGETLTSKNTELYATIEGKPSYICHTCIANIKLALASKATIKPFSNTMDTQGNTMAQGTPKKSNCAYQMMIYFNTITLNVADVIYLTSAGYTIIHSHGYYFAKSPIVYGGNVLGAFLADTFRACFIARNVKMSKARFAIKAYTHNDTIEDVTNDDIEDELYTRAQMAETFRAFTDEYRAQHMGKKGWTFPIVDNSLNLFSI